MSNGWLSEPTLGAVFIFIIGACIGSFSNVVIYRWPKGLSIIRPGSHCFSCKASISWYDNLPIFGWFLLRGRCRHCGAAFSFRYALVELLMAVFFLAAFLHLGISWYLLEILIFIFGVVTASFIDLDHFLLPDVLTLSGVIIGLVGAWLNPERSFVDALVGVLLGGGFLWSIAYLYLVIRKQEGMGGGDIKLLAWIGAVLGWKSIAFVIISSSFIGSIVGLLYAARSKKRMQTMIPFGPYLALGAVLYLFGGQGLGDWYLSLFLPFVNSP